MLTLLLGLFLAGQATGSLKFTAPADWKTRTPSSSMRVAEFLLPKQAGDAADAELVIYYFGTQGGSVDANIDRWIGQMQQPDGKPSKDVAKRGEVKANGLTITTLELPGTYVAEMSPGAAEHHNSPGYRLMTAVIPTAKGAYYLKLVGPDKTVKHWSASFQTFLQGLRFES
jgi:hypothetical protein